MENSDSTVSDEQLYRILTVCAVVIVLVAAAGYAHIVGSNQKNADNSYSQINAGDYRELLLYAYEKCQPLKVESKDQNKHCEDVHRLISGYRETSDLSAQQSMAASTKGILIASWFQFVVSVVTIALVGITLYATWRMLQQAAATTAHARETLAAANAATEDAKETVSITREAESAQVFFVFTVGFNGRDPNWPDLKGIREGSDWDEKESVFVDVKVINYGRSPAMNIVCGYESHNGFDFGEFDSDGGPQSVRIETMGPDAERVFGAKTIIRTPQLIQDAPTDGFVFTVEYDNIFGERIFRTQRAGIEFYRGVVRAWDLLGNNAVLPDDWRAMSEEERAKWDVRQLGFVDRVEIESSVTNYGKSRDKSDQKDYPYRSPSVSPTDT